VISRVEFGFFVCQFAEGVVRLRPVMDGVLWGVLSEMGVSGLFDGGD